MTVHVVTRHRGALDWLAKRGIRWDRQHAHLDRLSVRPDDEVIGILPMRLVAEICALGARYHHIWMNLPDSRRGAELSLQEMEAYGAELKEFLVLGRPCCPAPLDCGASR